jgi:lysophospholipase L1-like esterase
MHIDIQNEAVKPQALQQDVNPEEAAERQGVPSSNTSLLEIKDQVHLSPEGRALLARMEGMD